MPNYDMLVSRGTADKLGLFPAGDPRAGHGGASAEGAGSQTGTPYGILLNAGWQTPAGVLCSRPPYGGIRAIDLASGKTLWDRPFGSARRNGPFGLPTFIPLEIGTPNNGGSVVTAGGLIFIAAATDDLIKAIDINTGEIVWSDVLQPTLRHHSTGTFTCGWCTVRRMGRSYGSFMQRRSDGRKRRLSHLPAEVRGCR
jgi:quinoprotein glucose dehydrogenase